MKKLLLSGIAALFLTTGPTPSLAQDCDYNSPSYFPEAQKVPTAATSIQNNSGLSQGPAGPSRW